MPTNSARTFVALPIPPALRQKLERMQTLLAPDLPGTRWATPDQFHLTLAFLGDVPDFDLAAVCRGVADACAGVPALTLNLQGLGAFPDPTRPRVVWVGLAGPDHAALVDLQAEITRQVAAVGYPPEGADRFADQFNPHITLGRLKGGKHDAPDLSERVNHFRTWSAGNFIADRVVTYASTLAPEGPTYMTLATAPLGPKKGAPRA